MIMNTKLLLEAAPIKDMLKTKQTGAGGTSFGMSEAGYDIRIKQSVRFREGTVETFIGSDLSRRNSFKSGRFTLASAIEEFQMPNCLVGIVHDKSTWARRGLSVFNTVIEPGWKGFLTLELVYHGEGELLIPAGSGIAQVIFHETTCPAAYTGKYQGQPDRPVSAIDSK